MKKSNKFFKKGLSLLLAGVTLFTSVFSGVDISTVEASTKTTTAPTNKVYLSNSGKVQYSTYSTHYYYTYTDESDSIWYAYCADPDGGVPDKREYEIDYSIENYYDSSHAAGIDNFKEAIYQLWGQPGYKYGYLKEAVETYLGDVDWDNNAWDDDSLYVISHLLVSYYMGCDVDEVFVGVDTKFTDFFYNAYSAYYNSIGAGFPYTYDYAISAPLRQIYGYLANANVTVQSDFDVYVVKTQDVSSSYQLILGTYYSQEYTVNDYGYIKVLKESTSTSEYSLKGAVYGVYYDQSCTSEVARITIGDDGTGTSGKLYLGNDGTETFYVKEISAPEGYTVSDEIKPVTVTKDNTSSVPAEVTMTETPITADLTVNKTDAETGEITAQGSAKLNGAEYTIYNNSGCDIYYNGSTIANGDPVTTITIKNGTATASALPYGDYIVKETKAPEGYNADTTEYKLSITKDSDDDGDKTLSVDDEVKRGGVEIYKIDAETGKKNAQGDATLQGAEFEIVNNSTNAVWYDKDGDGKVDSNEMYKKGDVVLTITTDKYGYASTDSDALPYGNYIIRETSDGAPTGYLGTGVTSQTFSISEDGVLVDMTDTNNSIANNVKRGGVEVTKIDSETLKAEAQGDGTLQGAKFTIYNASTNDVYVNGVTYASGTSSSNNGVLSKNASNVTYMDNTTAKTYYLGGAIMTIETGEDGTVSINTSSLPYGTYVIKETTAPTGYLLSDMYYVFTIREDGEVEEITVDDDIKRGGVSIYKMDEDLVDIIGADEALGISQGDATLKNATYAIVNRSTHAVLVNNVLYDPNEICYYLYLHRRRQVMLALAVCYLLL